MNTYTIYSKTGCPYCEKTVEVMQRLNLKYVVKELDRDYTRDQFYDKFGLGSTFPRVIYTEHVLGQDGNVEEQNIVVGGMQETVAYLKDKKII